MKNIALVAHDNRKADLIEWVGHNIGMLKDNRLICTGTTGKLVEKLFTENGIHKDVTRLKSGPLGGDQQLGAMIVDGKIDLLIFFTDPMAAQPHDVDIKALMRICVLYNVAVGVNRTSADYLISSSLFTSKQYKPIVKDYTNYTNRKI